MNYRELHARYLQIFEYISKSRIKDAIDAVGVLANLSRNKDFREQIDAHAETYLNMLKYAFELSDDPQKEKVYNRLAKSVISLADDVKEDIIRSNNLLSYYNLRRLPDPLAESKIADLSKMNDQLVLQKEPEQEPVSGNALTGLYFRRSTKTISVMCLISSGIPIS